MFRLASKGGVSPKKPEAPGRCGIYDGPAEKLFEVDLGSIRFVHAQALVATLN